MATLSDRLSKLEGAAPTKPARTFPKLGNVASSDVGAFGFALEDGYWPNLMERPAFASMLEYESITAEQGAVLGTLSREVMASEQPKGEGWAGTRFKS
jgi:hypothetical protein